MNWDIYLPQAKLNEPEGVICKFCSKENNFVDDCGFFYISPLPGMNSWPVCESCYRGCWGRAHVQRYGLGER